MGWKIGITGGIGAGKSTVARIFETLDIQVYYADQRANYLMNNEAELKGEISSLLGKNAYRDGTLDRKYVASKIFGDLLMLERLNGLVHPAVAVDYQKWHEGQHSHYTLEEAALIYESGSFLYLDAVINVHVNSELRIARVVRRDQSTPAEVKARMENQWPEERRMQLADFVIFNDGTRPLIPQVLEIHRELMGKAK